MRVRVIEKQAHIIFWVAQGNRTKKRLVKSWVSDRHALCSFSATDNMYVRTYVISHTYISSWCPGLIPRQQLRALVPVRWPLLQRCRWSTSETDCEKACRALKGPDGKYLNVGWPAYVKGILTEEEQCVVEEYGTKVFAWAVREPKFMNTLLSWDADLCPLVELVRYDEFVPKFKRRRALTASQAGLNALDRQASMAALSSTTTRKWIWLVQAVLSSIDYITKDCEGRNMISWINQRRSDF